MRLSDYDKAVIKYFTDLFPNTVFGYQQRQLWQAAEDNQQVKVELPLIGINRVTQTFLFDSYHSEPLVLQGHFEPELGAIVRQVAIELTYQLDIYSNSREEVDDLWRELVRAILDHRWLDVPVVWKKKGVLYRFPLSLKTSPVDNTDILRFPDTNKLYRITQDFSVDQAKLFFAETPEEGNYSLIQQIPVKQIVLERNLDADTYIVKSLSSN